MSYQPFIVRFQRALLFGLIVGRLTVAALGQDFLTGGTDPRETILTDFNSDGIADALVVHAGPPLLTLLPGDGVGGFGEPLPIALSATAGTAVVGDFNNDAYADIAVASSGADDRGVYLLLGDGAGGFAEALFYPVERATPGAYPGDPAVADVNGDQVLDLFIATGDRHGRVLYGDGLGGWTPGAGLEWPVPPCPAQFIICHRVYSDWSLADFNEDGRLDLAGILNVGIVYWRPPTSWETTELIVRFGDAEGTFSEGTSLRVSGGSYLDLRQRVRFAPIDVNQDGHMDALVQVNALSFLVVGLGDGQGGFTGVSTPASALRFSLFTRPALADWDRDGVLDLAVSAQGGGYLIGQGDGTGRFQWSAQGAGSGPYRSVSAADVNLDGYADLLLVPSAGQTITVRLNDGTGRFNPVDGPAVQKLYE